MDGIPIEAFQNSFEAKEDLFALVLQIWEQEHVPKDMAIGELIPFFKNKGSSDDFSKYRMIGLINHAMKMLSTQGNYKFLSGNAVRIQERTFDRRCDLYYGQANRLLPDHRYESRD